MSEPVLMLPSMCLPSHTSNICRIRQVCSFQQGLGPMRSLDCGLSGKPEEVRVKRAAGRLHMIQQP